MQHIDIIEEMLNNELDFAFDNEDINEEKEEEFIKVLEELIIKTLIKLPTTRIQKNESNNLCNWSVCLQKDILYESFFSFFKNATCFLSLI